jgi:hypothetical protein
MDWQHRDHEENGIECREPSCEVAVAFGVATSVVWSRRLIDQHVTRLRESPRLKILHRREINTRNVSRWCKKSTWVRSTMESSLICGQPTYSIQLTVLSKFTSCGTRAWGSCPSSRATWQLRIRKKRAHLGRV